MDHLRQRPDPVSGEPVNDDEQKIAFEPGEFRFRQPLDTFEHHRRMLMIEARWLGEMRLRKMEPNAFIRMGISA